LSADCAHVAGTKLEQFDFLWLPLSLTLLSPRRGAREPDNPGSIQLRQDGHDLKKIKKY
jgi:hypothetical protein